MKKLVSLALSAVLALSSMSAFAAPNIYGVESDAEVDVNLVTKIGTTQANAAVYDDSTSPLTITTKTGAATIETRAEIDMTDFANAWKTYVDAGANFVVNDPTYSVYIDYDTARAAILRYASLTGEFTIKVTVDKEISCSTINMIWSDNASALFSEKSRNLDDSDPDKNVLTIVMEIADDTTNKELDTYFMGVLANPQTADETMSLKLSNVKVAGAYGETFDIETRFSGKIEIDVPDGEDMTISFDESNDNYVELKKDSFGGTGGGIIAQPTEEPTEAPTEEPTEAPVPTLVPEIPVDDTPQTQGTSKGATLNYEDHYAYIIGYDAAEDGTVEIRPENNITRAEVATIFYRLLSDEARETYMSDENDFTDVDADDWFNKAVSTVTRAGVFEGYDDGSFDPNAAITRAEFATIASRFSSLEYEGGPLFTDVAGHWAEDNINRAAITGWINGYNDRTFRPDNKITRAEAITLINRVVYRLIDTDHVHLDDIVEFVDNDPDAWYYNAIVEASNSHDYERDEIGKFETHIELIENIDWESHQ